jgi:hypothetical protein
VRDERNFRFQGLTEAEQVARWYCASVRRAREVLEYGNSGEDVMIKELSEEMIRKPVRLTPQSAYHVLIGHKSLNPHDHWWKV